MFNIQTVLAGLSWNELMWNVVSQNRWSFIAGMYYIKY